MRFDYLARISLNNLRLSADLAIDLGTVNTRIYSRDRGVVVNEPSAVALDDRTGEVQAVGTEAKEMLGRTPANIRVVRPLKDSVIADFKVTEKMLNYLGTTVQGARNRIVFDRPYLPKGIPQLWIKGLRSSNASVDLFFERRNDAVRVEVTDQQGDIEVVATP